MIIESGLEGSHQQIMDIVHEVFGPKASVIAMDDDNAWFQIQLIINQKNIVLDIGLAPPDEVTSTQEYEFKKLVIADSKNLFVTAEFKNFCQWGMKFEKGRLQVLLFRLQGLLEELPLEGEKISDINQPDSDRAVLAETLNPTPVGNELHPDTPNETSSIGTSTLEDGRWRHRAAKIGIVVGFAFAGGGSSYFLFNQPGESAGSLSSAASSASSYSSPAPVTPMQRTTLSTPVPTASECLTIIATATGTEHGLLPWLRTIKHENLTFFTGHHLTPQAVVTATIRPRHRAEALAHEQTSTLHAVGEQHHYHFGRVVPGDQISLQACPHSPATMSYSRGSMRLYTFEFVR